jgi:hypothetical protein
MRPDWWRRGAEILVMAVKWLVGNRDHQRNVYLALKKLDLRTWIKTAIDVGEKTANMEERAID